MRTRELLTVSIGGALGTLARVGALEATEHYAHGSLIATLAANLVGAFGLAFVLGRGLPEFPEWVRSGITIGFFGSYTTFSAIALITVTTPFVWAIGYLALTLATGALAVLAGRSLGARAGRGLTP